MNRLNTGNDDWYQDESTKIMKIMRLWDEEIKIKIFTNNANEKIVVFCKKVLYKIIRIYERLLNTIILSKHETKFY